MDIKMLKEMNEQVEKAYTFIEQLEEWQTDISNHLALLGRFIDEAIARQSTTSLIPHNINYYKCKKCEQLIHKYIHKPKYCPSCGKPVKED